MTRKTPRATSGHIASCVIHYTHRYTHKAIVKVQIEFKWYNLMKKDSLQLTRVEAGDGPLGGPEFLLPQDLPSYLRCTSAELRSGMLV